MVSKLSGLVRTSKIPQTNTLLGRFREFVRPPRRIPTTRVHPKAPLPPRPLALEPFLHAAFLPVRADVKVESRPSAHPTFTPAQQPRSILRPVPAFNPPLWLFKLVRHAEKPYPAEPFSHCPSHCPITPSQFSHLRILVHHSLLPWHCPLLCSRQRVTIKLREGS